MLYGFVISLLLMVVCIAVISVFLTALLSLKETPNIGGREGGAGTPISSASAPLAKELELQEPEIYFCDFNFSL